MGRLILRIYADSSPQNSIERFRGIKLLDWQPAGEFICLVGPDDSTKSTIIEAIELTLSPRWDYAFDDSNFLDGNTDSPIMITATVGQLPDALRSDNKFGLHIRGWSQTGLRDEPAEGDEDVQEFGVRTIICLLSEEQLKFYGNIPGGLLAKYQFDGFAVQHIGITDPASDSRGWKELETKLEAVYSAFQRSLKPVLIHCSVGIDRTGKAVSYIRAKEQW